MFSAAVWVRYRKHAGNIEKVKVCVNRQKWQVPSERSSGIVCGAKQLQMKTAQRLMLAGGRPYWRELARQFLRGQFHVSYFIYGTALINVLVLAKVILIGEYAHLGKKHEAKPLSRLAVHKPFLFSLLVLAFQIVEEGSKQLLHGDSMATASHEIHHNQLLARTVVTF